MTVRKPAVVGPDGRVQQLQPGDRLDVPSFDPTAPPSPFGFVFFAENMDLPLIFAGAAVSPHPSGVGLVLASALTNLRQAMGLAQADISTAASGWIQTRGLFKLADWTPVVGTPLLAARATYFLHPTLPGKLTTTPPVAPGNVVQIMGVTVFPDTLDIRIEEAILL